MASYSTNELKTGYKVLVDDNPCNIVDLEFVKPGKGQAFVRVKVKNLLDERVRELTLKSGDSIEAADVMETTMQYIYSDASSWHFMDPQTYEQYSVGEAAMGGAQGYLKENMECAVTLWNGNPIAVEAPNHVTLEISQTDPGVRGDTSSGGSKPATLETGAVVKVPLFISEGEQIVVDTRTGEYVSRAKD